MQIDRHYLVCPPEPELIGRIERRDIVLRTTHLVDLAGMVEMVNERNRLHQVWCVTDQPFSSLPLTDEHRRIPIVVFAPELGDVKRLMRLCPLLKQAKVTVFLPGVDAAACTGLKMLSSLGIPCGLHLTPSEEIDWVKAGELLAYALLHKVQRAPIEPFQYALQNFQNNRLLAIQTPYFRNHHVFLHVTGGGLALSHEEAMQGTVVASLSELEIVHDAPGYIGRSRERERFFVDAHLCSSCPVWRMCGGVFADSADKASGCQRFFGDLLEAIDLLRMGT